MLSTTGIAHEQIVVLPACMCFCEKVVFIKERTKVHAFSEFNPPFNATKSGLLNQIKPVEPILSTIWKSMMFVPSTLEPLLITRKEEAEQKIARK